MAYNRVQLNDLIFHDAVVLPRGSAGFGEVSLAVAELQGGDLSKAAADVFGATGTDLRTERALFCLERAVECAPTRRPALIRFFVSNVLAHYVALLCTAAEERAEKWMEAESEAARRHDQAALFSALGMSAALMIFFANKFGVRAVTGSASGWAYAESAQQERDATLARIVARGHRSASLLHFVPARDLIWLSAKILEAEGLPAADALDPVISGFVGSLRTVLGVHLHWLKDRLDTLILAHIRGDSSWLLQSYGGSSSTASPHPESEATLCCLKQLLPRIERSAEYMYLAYPVKLALGPMPEVPDNGCPGSSAGFTVVYRIAFALAFLILVGAKNPAGAAFFGYIAYWAHGRARELKVERQAWENQRQYAHNRRVSRRNAEEARLHAVVAKLWVTDTWLDAGAKQAIKTSVLP